MALRKKIVLLKKWEVKPTFSTLLPSITWGVSLLGVYQDMWRYAIKDKGVEVQNRRDQVGWPLPEF